MLLEAGDILLTEDGHWEAETRPEEYRSVYNFIKYLGDDERKTFTLEELQELVSNSGQPYQEVLAELRRLGFRIVRPPIEHEVRGIGRSKNTRD